MMKIKKYQNNLRLVVNTKKDVDVVSFKIFVNVGSKDETSNEYGFAHFLEHMFFKSTKQTSYNNLLKKLDDLGALKNAYTGVNKTCYYFKSLSGVVEECTSVFSEMFFNTSFNKDELEKEKLVILEEYKMGEDDAIKKCLSQAYCSMFANTDYGHDIIGTPTSIKSVTVKKLQSFKEKHYSPENIVISVAGNISFKQAKKLVDKYFMKNFAEFQAKSFKETKSHILNPSKKYILHKKENKQSVVYLFGDLKEKNLHQRIIFNLLFAIIGMGMSSKLFEIIRGKLGLVYNIDAGCSRVGNNFLYEIFFATSNEKVADALVAIKGVLKDCANGNITEQELTKTKNKYVSEMVFESESCSRLAEANGLDILEYNKIITNKYLEKEYLSVTIEEIIECARIAYEETNYVISAVGMCGVKDLKAF